MEKAFAFDEDNVTHKDIESIVVILSELGIKAYVLSAWVHGNILHCIQTKMEEW